MKNLLPIPILILTVYLLTNLVVPVALKSEMIFLADATLWATVIVTIILITKRQQVRIWKMDKTLIQLAVIVAIFQLFLLIFTSFFMGFGKNSITWTSSALAIYFPYLLTSFLGVEISRAFLAQTTSKRRPTLALLFISLFCTLITISTSKYTSAATPLAMSEFLIRTFIPTLAISLLATYFALLGGFTANLIYTAIPAFFTWFSPILPNPPWEAQSMITVIAATIGFLVLDQAVRPFPTKRTHRTLIKQKSQIPYWTAIALIGLIAVWSSTGLLGFTPTIIASGSMTPTLNPGDITIIISTPPATIKVGDIIEYRTADAPITHRVIDKYEAGGSLWFITKGDANNAPDPDPIPPRNIVGKLVFTIPKLGWISIAIKTLITEAYAFFTTNLTYAYTTLAIIIPTSAFGIHRYRNQPLRKLRRRLNR